MLWDKGEETDKDLLKFTVGDDRELDSRLFYYDCLASAAHAEMLFEVGLLTKEEAKSLKDKLLELSKNTPKIPETFEDSHSYLESLLIEALGDTGAKIHLGRSRNDQVQVAIRLFMKEELKKFLITLLDVAKLFHQRSKENILIPGYTHLKPAMPTTSGVWFGSFAEGLLEVLDDGFHLLQSIDKNPLGSGSGFNTGLKLDKKRTADILGFSRVQRNPIDVQSSRGRLECKVLGVFVTFAHVISRFAWDVVLYSSSGLVELENRITTGSSLMPQKRNPDLHELLRGKCGVIRGIYSELLSIIGSLPSSYHRDFQLTKAPLMRGFDTVLSILKILPVSIAGIKFNKDKFKDFPELFATYQAFEKVKSGVPFRNAYKEVAIELKNSLPNPEKFGSYIDQIKSETKIVYDELEEDLKKYENMCSGILGRT